MNRHVCAPRELAHLGGGVFARSIETVAEKNQSAPAGYAFELQKSQRDRIVESGQSSRLQSIDTSTETRDVVRGRLKECGACVEPDEKSAIARAEYAACKAG